MKDLLLEIGTEEIPARFLPPGLALLLANGKDRLQQAGLSFGEARVFGTPRRMAWVVEGLAPQAQDRIQEFLGPALTQARDAQGHWTAAAQGFARSQGVLPEQLEVRSTDRGERLAFVKKTPGASTEKILPVLLPELIRSLSFPKSMVWEESRFAFARPIRWLVALYGVRTISFSLAGVKTGRRTHGLRFSARRPFEVSAPHRYAALLKNHCVIVDPEERRRLIVQQIDHVAKTHHGCIPLGGEADLLEEVTHLVEHPVAVVGQFDPHFLSVPQEVLVISMKKHQKYFPVFKDETCRELLPFFVAVRNGFSDHQAVVREGYERVLAARLNDAAFFFSEHTKRRLETRVVDLQGIAFLSPALSLKDKTDRVTALTDGLADQRGASPEVRRHSARVAFLAKADLTTGLVGEFPELQGVVGRLYAERDGEPAVVARSVEQHHWPLSAEGPLPVEEPAALVSVADKMDTLAGNFLIGQVPSGSQDPYGLRRSAVGVLRILETREWKVSLGDLTARAFALLPASLAGDRRKAAQNLMDFFQQRWSALAEGRGFRADEVAAVCAAGFGDVGDAWARLTALRDVRRHQDFAPLSIAFKRAAHLLKQAQKQGESSVGVAHPPLFQTEAERALGGRLGELRVVCEALLAERRYPDVLAALVSLRGPVDNFFVQTVVMDPDPALRQNRLALLAGVRSLFSPVADFSRLQETPSSSA